MKKMSLTVFAVCMCLWFIFASTPGPKLFNINSSHQNLSVKTKDIQPRSDVKTVQPDIDFGNIPLYFIANQGQVNAKASFYAKASRYTLWMTKEGLVFDSSRQVEVETTHPAPLGHPSQEGSFKMERDVSRLMFVGANKNPEISAIQPAELKVNYYIGGNDKSKWHSGVPTSMAVLYKSLYKNVDLKVYGIEKQIEYDWIVKPGGDPGDIRIQFRNVKGTHIDEEGNLLIETKFGELMHKRPVSFQETGNEKIAVKAEFKKIAENTYGFEVDSYDKSCKLIIDPFVKLKYSTYLGGNGIDEANGIAVDNSGCIYVAGNTTSPVFPFPQPAPSPIEEYQGDVDIFVAKLNNTGSAVEYFTYLGGTRKELGGDIAVDTNGNAYVVGTTYSWNIPIPPNALGYKKNFIGASDAIIAKLDNSGNIIYFTYLGGGGFDGGSSIAVDDSQNAYVTGGTDAGGGFPQKGWIQPDTISSEIFVSQLDTTTGGAQSLVYSTCMGGNSHETGNAIAISKKNNVPGYYIYVAGHTESTDFNSKYDTLGEKQWTWDAFVFKLNPDISSSGSLLYSTYLGSNAVDRPFGIAADSQGNAYVTGVGFEGNGNIFVIKLDTNVTGTTAPLILFDRYLYSGGVDFGADIALDPMGNVYVTGFTAGGAHFTPLLNEYQGYNYGQEVVVAMLDKDGNFIYSTLLGGTDHEHGVSIAVDGKGNAYVAGHTTSTDFPYTSTGYGIMGHQSGRDAFIAKLSYPINEPPVADAGTDVSCVQGDTVQLDGSGSYDPDGDPLTYSWVIESKPNGSNAVLSDGNKVAPSLETDLPGDYVIKLVVNDGTVDSDPDTVTVTAISFVDALTQTMNNLINTINSIPVSSFSNKQHKTNMIKFVQQAMNLITANTLPDYCDAKDKLTNAQRKVDGCDGGNVKDDWIVIPCPSKVKSDVYNLFQGAINLIDQITLEQWNHICP
ncbi:MAG: SBBP repeat-containing protein [Candidatus Aminicenantes bacterium]|jgi:hypothetical protein